MPTAFLNDITPFLWKKKILYVDAGAYVGTVYTALRHSPLSLLEAHLFEPNVCTFEELQKNLSSYKDNVNLYNMALSNASRPNLRLVQNESMSRILMDDALEDHTPDTVQPTTSISLDEAVENFAKPHIDILKIDVEGHEMQVLEGMRGLLKKGGVDVIYLEAGLDPENSQQTYYRKIEDFLGEYGLKIFKVYEQCNEWPTDSPLLRRMNIAFMSTTFAARHPYQKTLALYQQEQALVSRIAALRKLDEEKTRLLKDIETIRGNIVALR